MSALALLLALLQDPPKPDRTNAEATAKAVLAAYKAKDLDALGALSGSVNQGILKELKEQGEKHARYASIFGGHRWAAVGAWEGKAGPARYFGTKRAQVAFGEPPAEGRLTVLELEWEEGRWCFEDVKVPSKANFEAGSLEAPKR